MLVCFWFSDVRKVEGASRMEHGLSQGLLLGVIHALEVNSHQQRTDLIIGNAIMRNSLDEEHDLFARQTLAVSFFSDDVLRSQAFPLGAFHQNNGLDGYSESLAHRIKSLTCFGLDADTAHVHA